MSPPSSIPFFFFFSFSFSNYEFDHITLHFIHNLHPTHNTRRHQPGLNSTYSSRTESEQRFQGRAHASCRSGYTALTAKTSGFPNPSSTPASWPESSAPSGPPAGPRPETCCRSWNAGPSPRPGLSASDNARSHPSPPPHKARISISRHICCRKKNNNFNTN